MDNQQQLKTELADKLQWQGAHVSFKNAVKKLSLETISNTEHGLPYTIWQLADHIRSAQYDIVSFSLDEEYQELNWPEDYWPKEDGPASMEEWQHVLQAIEDDRKRMIEAILHEDTDLFKPIERGNGQHLFREAILIIDHEAYHTGQIVLIRKLLNDWH